MAAIDIFNGDADGICALLQMRHAAPRPDARLVTGVKRDIQLVAKAGIEAGDDVTVLDISFDQNRDAVVAALDNGARVFYVDHHFAGEIPEHPRLTTRIDTSADVCTSLLVHGHLGGPYPGWAVTGAFGDNLDDSARALAERSGLDAAQTRTLARLGTCINYNGYGTALEDLHFPPAALFERLLPFADPLAFVEDDRATFEKLTTGYDQDLARARDTLPFRETAHAAVFVLPDAPWARRVSGVFGNELAKQTPSRAHAVITDKGDRTFVVSVRAPLERKTGADELCREFATGGGRAAAAGINALPHTELDAFASRFAEFFG